MVFHGRLGRGVSLTKFKGIALAGGLLLLAFLVYHIGLALLVEYLLRVGWWMLVLLLIAAVRHSFRTVACRWAMGEEHRQLSFAAMYGVLLVSEAIKQLGTSGSDGADLADRLARELNRSEKLHKEVIINAETLETRVAVT